jgi:hypothetical protein
LHGREELDSRFKCNKNLRRARELLVNFTKT